MKRPLEAWEKLNSDSNIDNVVGHCGLEPQTPVLSGLCSNRLS